MNSIKKRLQLKRVQNNIGNWLEDNAEMAEEAVRFFQAQFHEDIVPIDFGILDHVPTMVDSTKNLDLIQHPTKEEVKYAVFGLNGKNVGGSYGFTRCLFHSC